jgi:hypothetical protein
MDGFTVAWLLWLAMFAVIEGVAIFNKRSDDTLSEHVWKWFSVRNKSRGWLLRRGVLALFLTWLTVHMLAG